MFISKTNLIRILFLIWLGTVSLCSDKNTSHRITNSFKPSSYDLTLNLNPDKDTFTGLVIIDMFTTYSVKNVLLNASPKRITNVTSVLLDYAHICETEFLEELEMLSITCPQRFEKNDEYKLIIEYEGAYGSLKTGNEYLGFYKSSYETSEGKRNYIVTQFEPTFARTMFPCFDEPNYKATFAIEVKYPDKYSALSNAGIHSETRYYG